MSSRQRFALAACIAAALAVRGVQVTDVVLSAAQSQAVVPVTLSKSGSTRQMWLNVTVPVPNALQVVLQGRSLLALRSVWLQNADTFDCGGLAACRASPTRSFYTGVAAPASSSNSTALWAVTPPLSGQAAVLLLQVLDSTALPSTAAAVGARQATNLTLSLHAPGMGCTALQPFSSCPTEAARALQAHSPASCLAACTLQPLFRIGGCCASNGASGCTIGPRWASTTDLPSPLPSQRAAECPFVRCNFTEMTVGSSAKLRSLALSADGNAAYTPFALRARSGSLLRVTFAQQRNGSSQLLVGYAGRMPTAPERALNDSQLYFVSSTSFSLPVPPPPPPQAFIGQDGGDGGDGDGHAGHNVTLWFGLSWQPLVEVSLQVSETHITRRRGCSQPHANEQCKRNQALTAVTVKDMQSCADLCSSAAERGPLCCVWFVADGVSLCAFDYDNAAQHKRGTYSVPAGAPTVSWRCVPLQGPLETVIIIVTASVAALLLISLAYWCTIVRRRPRYGSDDSFSRLYDSDRSSLERSDEPEY